MVLDWKLITSHYQPKGEPASFFHELTELKASFSCESGDKHVTISCVWHILKELEWFINDECRENISSSQSKSWGVG